MPRRSGATRRRHGAWAAAGCVACAGWGVPAVLAQAPATGAAAGPAAAPTFETRQQVLRSLVQVTATDCPDGTQRTGSGFAFEQPSRVITAHHVVGGCRELQVSYEGVAAAAGQRRKAQRLKVLAAGDLALLQVADAPAVPVLRLAAGTAPRGGTYAGFGYANGMPTAGDQVVQFSTGASRLRDILPQAAVDELRRVDSPIAAEREVLRFNVALQPGMSGGPIVNPGGEVIGVIAGGLKAGAAPASWGWPGAWVRDLLASSEPVDRAVRVAGTYYTQSELQTLAQARRSGRRLTCGGLEFVDTGRRTLADLVRGADDIPRVQHIMNLSREPQARLAGLQFQVWLNEASGATALVPAGTELAAGGEACVARAPQGGFRLVVWAARTPTAADVQWRSQEFEQRVIGPMVPYSFGFQIDTQLTTMIPNPMTGLPMPGPQLRDNGLIFNRKGVTLAKRMPRFMGDVVPYAHAFETLVARGGTFLGVGVINDELHPMLNPCLMGQAGGPACQGVPEHLHEWTRYVLATQLSTYPAY